MSAETRHFFLSSCVVYGPVVPLTPSLILQLQMTLFSRQFMKPLQLFLNFFKYIIPLLVIL